MAPNQSRHAVNNRVKIETIIRKLAAQCGLDHVDVDVESHAPSEHIRVAALIEKAFWLYLDVEQVRHPHLRQMKRDVDLLLFTKVITVCCSNLHPLIDHEQELIEAYLAFKRERSTAGAILLDPNGYVLVVRAWGEGPRWGFPKGGVEPPEQPGGALESLEECAIREVMEETGLDVSEAIRRHPDWCIERNVGSNGKVCRLYIVQDWCVHKPLGTPDVSQHEITGSGWVHLDDLPTDWHQEQEYTWFNKCGQAEGYRFVFSYVSELLDRLRRGNLEARFVAP